MGMKKCKNCGKSISSNASRCPGCAKPTSNLAFGKCRACGQVLEHSRHRFYASGGVVVVNGNSASSRTLIHVPCPNCGEPKPLRYFITDTCLGKLLGVFVFVPGLLLLVVKLPDYLDKHHYFDHLRVLARRHPETFKMEFIAVSALFMLPFIILFFRARAIEKARRG